MNINKGIALDQLLTSFDGVYKLILKYLLVCYCFDNMNGGFDLGNICQL